MQVLEDVEEAVDEEGVVLDELVVLGHLAWRQQPQLRVDRLVPLHRRLPRHHSGIRLNQIPAGRRRVSPRPRRVREWGRRRRRLVAGSAASGEEAAPGWARRGAGEMVGEVEVFECYLYGRMVVIWWWARLEKFMLLSPVLSWEVSFAGWHLWNSGLLFATFVSSKICRLITNLRDEIFRSKMIHIANFPIESKSVNFFCILFLFHRVWRAY